MDKQEEINRGISLFKIDYEIDGQENIWQAGIVGIDSQDAVASLTAFLKKSVKNFKGYKIDTLEFKGAVHHLSEAVRDLVLESSGAIVKPEKTKKKVKSKILAKDKK